MPKKGQATAHGELLAMAALLRRHAERVLDQQSGEDAMVDALGDMVDGLPSDALQTLVALAASGDDAALANAALRQQINAAALRCCEEHVDAQDGRRAHLFALPMAIAGSECPSNRRTALTVPQLDALARILARYQLAPDADIVLLPWLLSAHEAMFLTLGEVHLLKLRLCAGDPQAAMQAIATATALRDSATRAHIALIEQTEQRLQDHVVLLAGIVRSPPGAAAPYSSHSAFDGAIPVDAAQNCFARALGCALELLKPAAAWSANVPGCSALPRAMRLPPENRGWDSAAVSPSPWLH